jgi:predicted nucleic acid-binding protein
MVVIDASVLIADLQPLEPHHADARALIQQLTRHRVRVCCPNLVLAEVVAGVARSTERLTVAQQALVTLRRRKRYEFVVVDESLIDRAALIAMRQQVRGCDAVYIALAEAKRIPLVTLDRQQKDRAPAGVTALAPVEMLLRIAQGRI